MNPVVTDKHTQIQQNRQPVNSWLKGKAHNIIKLKLRATLKRKKYSLSHIKGNPNEVSIQPFQNYLYPLWRSKINGWPAYASHFNLWHSSPRWNISVKQLSDTEVCPICHRNTWCKIQSNIFYCMNRCLTLVVQLSADRDMYRRNMQGGFWKVRKHWQGEKKPISDSVAICMN